MEKRKETEVARDEVFELITHFLGLDSAGSGTTQPGKPRAFAWISCKVETLERITMNYGVLWTELVQTSHPYGYSFHLS